MTHMGDLDVWLDFSCPWSYIGHHQVVSSGRSDAVRVRAFQLNPDLPPEGIARRTYRVNKFGSQTESDRRDDRVVTAGRQTGIEIDFSKIDLTPNTRNAHRAVKAIEARGADTTQLTEAIFAAYFNDGADIGRPDVLVAVAARVGIQMTLDDFDSGTPQDRAIDVDIADAGNVGLTGVPYFVDTATHHPVAIGAAIARLTGGPK